MAGPNKMSDWERQIYEATVEEAVEDVARVDKSDVQGIDMAIHYFIQKVDFSDQQKEKFRHEVMQRVAERKRITEDGREQELLTGLEGKVIAVKKGSGVERKLVGTHEDEKFYARGGSLFRRIFGHRYNAEEVADKLTDIQELEDRIRRNQEQVDMITAARDASKKSLKVARQLFKQKREGRFVFGLIDDWRASWRAARQQKKHTATRYKQEMKGLTKLQDKNRKHLEKEKNAMERIMEKVDDRREKTREIFDKNFGAQVQYLLQLTGRRREVEEEELRDQIRKFGKNAKIVYLEYYLNEALGLEPKVLFDERGNEDRTPYREPLNERERLQELIDVEKWCKFVGRKVSQGQVEEVVQYFRQRNARLIVDIRSEDLSAPKPYLLIMRFLLKGEDTKGKKLLKKKQLAHFTPENVFRFYRMAQERSTNPAALQRKMEAFASLGKKYKAEDFDYMFNTLGSQSQPKKPKKKKKQSLASQQSQFGPTPGTQNNGSQSQNTNNQP